MIDFTEIVITIIGLIFTAVIVPLVGILFNWLRKKTKNEALLTAIDEAENVATNVVASLQAKIVNDLKAASEDGKLTEDEIEHIGNVALQMFASDLSSESMKVLQNKADSIEAYIKNLIESKLTDLKLAS